MDCAAVGAGNADIFIVPPALRTIQPAVVDLHGQVALVRAEEAAGGRAAIGLGADEGPVRILLVKLVVVLALLSAAIVGAEDVKAEAGGVVNVADIDPLHVHGVDGEAGGVESAGQMAHAPEHVEPDLGVLNAHLLIAQAPEDDRGVVAVAPDQALQLAQDLLGRAGQSHLVHDHHAQPITGVEQRRVGRVVAGANGIAADFLEPSHPPCLQARRHSHAHTGVILVAAHALELHGDAVEVEAGLGIDAVVAHAELRFVAVDVHAIHLHDSL